METSYTLSLSFPSESLLDLETWQALLHRWGYWAVFLGILLENAGIPLPGETITLLGGFWAGRGDLGYLQVLGSATAGAIVGDNIGYWIGATGGWAFLQGIARVFRLSPEQVSRVQQEFRRNADQAVFFGRFLTLLRIFAGPLAGLSQMPYPRFILFNSLGALTWACVTVTLAAVAGQSLPLEALFTHAGQVGGIALLLFLGWLARSRWIRIENQSL